VQDAVEEVQHITKIITVALNLSVALHHAAEVSRRIFDGGLLSGR
jgi:hypothetical protein